MTSRKARLLLGDRAFRYSFVVQLAYLAKLFQTLAGVAAAMKRSVKDLLLATNWSTKL